MVANQFDLTVQTVWVEDWLWVGVCVWRLEGVAANTVVLVSLYEWAFMHVCVYLCVCVCVWYSI